MGETAQRDPEGVPEVCEAAGHGVCPAKKRAVCTDAQFTLLVSVKDEVVLSAFRVGPLTSEPNSRVLTDILRGLSRHWQVASITPSTVILIKEISIDPIKFSPKILKTFVVETEKNP